MHVGFKARVDDPAIASYRYRVLAPIRMLTERGIPSEIYRDEAFDAYDAIVFSKAYREPDQALAARARDAGKRVLLDLCDNLFYNPGELEKYRDVRADLLRMIALCDRVICSTPVLAESIRNEAGLAELPCVAPDMFEQSPVPARPPRPVCEPAQLLWFGRHGSPNADAGMADLLLIADRLAEAARLRPLELIVCSDSEERFGALFADYPVPARYLAWSADSFPDILAAADAVLIPLSDNPFVAAKTHNRLTLALSAGVPVVADLIDSYRPFAPFCYLDDWSEGLRHVLLEPEAARARAAAAGDHLRAHWSAEAVAPQWEAAICRPSNPAAVTANETGAEAATATPMSAATWLAGEGRSDRPWLLAGPQAPAEAVAAARAEGYLVMSIGRGFAGFAADASLIVDAEILIADGEALIANGGTVITPNDLHKAGWASGHGPLAWSQEIPALESLIRTGRLATFDLWTAGGDGIEGDFAGEEVPLRLLVSTGVRVARHLGVRQDRRSISGLEAGQPIADRAAGGGGVARLRRESGLSYGPYGFPVPARIFVGSDDEQLLGLRLLEYSLQKYSTMDLVVERLDPSGIPIPEDPKNRSRTGFSFCRFDIPRLCGYQGRGVYVDADMQVFTDITDLWTLPLDDADVIYAMSHPSQGRTPQTSVMLLNCEALPWKVEEIIAGLDEGSYSYKELMQQLCIVPPGRVQPLLPDRWNSLERLEPGRTSLIHYTDMPTQPWVSHDNPNGALWYQAFAEALDEGFISREEVDLAIEHGHVSPRLPQWLGRGEDEVDLEADAVWVAPFHRFTRNQADIEGRVVLNQRRLRGWAFRPQAPDEPVRLAAYDGEELLFEFTADRHEPILERHGKGAGRCGFEVELPDDIWASNRTALSVRPVDGDSDLPGSPVQLLR